MQYNIIQYLPNGKWVRTNTREVIDGGQFVTCHASIDEFIAFVKEGSDVLSCF